MTLCWKTSFDLRNSSEIHTITIEFVKTHSKQPIHPDDLLGDCFRETIWIISRTPPILCYLHVKLTREQSSYSKVECLSSAPHGFLCTSYSCWRNTWPLQKIKGFIEPDVWPSKDAPQEPNKLCSSFRDSTTNFVKLQPTVSVATVFIVIIVSVQKAEEARYA